MNRPAVNIKAENRPKPVSDQEQPTKGRFSNKYNAPYASENYEKGRHKAVTNVSQRTYYEPEAIASTSKAYEGNNSDNKRSRN